MEADGVLAKFLVSDSESRGESAEEVSQLLRTFRDFERHNLRHTIKFPEFGNI